MLTKEGKNMFDFDCRDDLRAEKIMLTNKQGKSLISIFSTWWFENSNRMWIKEQWKDFVDFDFQYFFSRMQTYFLFINMWSVVHVQACLILVPVSPTPLSCNLSRRNIWPVPYGIHVGWLVWTSNDLSVDVWGVEICFQNFQISHDLTKHIYGDQSTHAPAPGATLVILWCFTIAASHCEGPKCQSSKSLSALFFAIVLSLMQF